MSQNSNTKLIKVNEYQRGNILVFALFLCYVIWWFLEGNFRFPSLGAIRFEFLLGALLALLALPAYFGNKSRLRSGLGIWVVLFFITAILMVPFSYVPEISYKVFIDRFFKYALFGFFIAAFVTTPKRLAFFVGAYLLSCLKLGQEGFFGAITGSMMWENQGIPRLHGSTPRYGHPNSFSGMALGCLYFCLFFFALVPKYLKPVLSCLVIFSIVIIVFTGSRTGYIGLIIGLIVFVLKAENRKKTLFILLAASIAIVPFIPHEYLERAHSTLTLEEKEGRSAETRIEIFHDAWQIFLENPFGIGVYAFIEVRKNRFGRAQDPHNLYLEIATNLGIQGLMIFVGLMIVLLRTLSVLTIDIYSQTKLIKQALAKLTSEGVISDLLREQLWDLQVMDAACRSIFLFLVIRLILGIFGHDLYEIYWWFVLGTTVAIWNINFITKHRTNAMLAYIKNVAQ